MRIITSAIMFLGFVLCAVTSNVVKAADTTLIDVINLPYNVMTIANDSAGNIWLSGSQGIQYYDFEKETFITTDPSYKSEIFSDQGRVIKFKPFREKIFYPYDEFEVWLTKIPPGYERVTAARDKSGRYWVSTGSQLFIFSVELRFEQILSGHSMRGIYQDGEDLYVNSYSGIFKNGKPLVGIRFGIGEIKKFGESIYIAWGALFRYQPISQNYEYLKFALNKNLPQSYNRPTRPLTVQNLHQIRDTIWVGTNFGLGYIDNDSVVMITNFPNIEDLIYFDDGLLIAGRSLVKPRNLPVPYHNLSKPGYENWKGIYLMQNNQLRKMNFPEYNYYQILEVDEHYYFASDSGIVVWDGDKDFSVIKEENGLTDNRTCTMELDEFGFLWVSTFSGLNRINLSTGKINHYLNNVEFNYRSVFQNDSMIFMGGVNGIYKFRPKDFLGDDIEHEPLLSIQQIFMLIGAGVILLVYLVIYFLKKYFRRQLLLKDAQIHESERKLFLLQIEQTVFDMELALTVKTLADALNTSERSLYRSFDKYSLTPGVHLKKLRLQKAIYLLKDNNDIYAIRKVAQKVGYSEQYLQRLLAKKQIKET